MKKTVGWGLFHSDHRMSASINSDWKDNNEQTF